MNIEELAKSSGMESLLNHGAASCVFSPGCNGVAQGDLERFAELVRLAERERLARQLEALPRPSERADAMTWYTAIGACAMVARHNV